MSQNSIEVAVVTVDPGRVEMIDHVVVPLGWQLTSCVGEQQPLNWLLSQRSDVILIDLDVEHAATLFVELKRIKPQVPVLALAMPERLVDLQSALLAGARDFIAFPINPQHFTTVIERAVNSEPVEHPIHRAGTTGDGALQSPAYNGQASMSSSQLSEMHMSTARPAPRRLIAVVGLRGGVGRSTIATNLAVAIQQRDIGNVTLVEAHHSLSHLALMLHLHPRNTLAGLNDDVKVDADIVEGHLQTHGSGISVLAAPAHLDDLVELSGDRWHEVLKLVKQISPIVIVDTAAATDVALLETLVVADNILVVLNPDIASLRSATALIKNLYNEPDVSGTIEVVLNRAGVGGGLDESTIRKQLGHELAISLPDDTGLATYAMNRGIPFVTSHARSLLTKRIFSLADKLVGPATSKNESTKSVRALLPFINALR